MWADTLPELILPELQKNCDWHALYTDKFNNLPQELQDAERDVFNQKNIAHKDLCKLHDEINLDQKVNNHPNISYYWDDYEWFTISNEIEHKDDGMNGISNQSQLLNPSLSVSSGILSQDIINSVWLAFSQYSNEYSNNLDYISGYYKMRDAIVATMSSIYPYEKINSYTKLQDFLFQRNIIFVLTGSSWVNWTFQIRTKIFEYERTFSIWVDSWLLPSMSASNHKVTWVFAWRSLAWDPPSNTFSNNIGNIWPVITRSEFQHLGRFNTEAHEVWHYMFSTYLGPFEGFWSPPVQYNWRTYNLKNLNEAFADLIGMNSINNMFFQNTDNFIQYLYLMDEVRKDMPWYQLGRDILHDLIPQFILQTYPPVNWINPPIQPIAYRDPSIVNNLMNFILAEYTNIMRWIVNQLPWYSSSSYQF